VTAVSHKTDGGAVTITSNETVSRLGVTCVKVTTSAPGCNGNPCEIDTLSQPANISATVTVPINKGKRTRETICTPAAVPVHLSM
jgi:hypothetical protein